MKRKINWKKGLFKTLLLVMISVFVFIGVGSVYSSANASKGPETIMVTVNSGESLWFLADKYGDNKIDIRKIIYQIQKMNNIKDTIYPGQVLEIPIN